MKLVFAIFLQILLFIYCEANYKKPKPIVEQKTGVKFNNPNFVRDRYKAEIIKPAMPDLFKERHRKPFNPAWMDYCDPYHCNDYHKTACGLNRKTMRFKWFQSVCHIILNNGCAAYRGALKYDIVDAKFCMIYVMYLRGGCPTSCDDNDGPVCALNSNNQVALFRSRCAMDMVNCKSEMEDFDEIDLSYCQRPLLN